MEELTKTYEAKHYKYSIAELTPYINWMYFYHAWGFGVRPKESEADELYLDAIMMLHELDKAGIQAQGITQLYRANSVGDDLILNGHSLPLLRQQTASAPDAPCLCLSDFVRPASDGATDMVGLFATSIEVPGAEDEYDDLLRQTLGDRLAEAAAERMHADVRKQQWGYAPDEQLSPEQLFKEEYQGIRPAVGYPSLPDLSIIFEIQKLLPIASIGIATTENGAMTPHSSVCGIMMAHPRSRYFTIGKITQEQLQDYAKRRGVPIEQLRRFVLS